MRIEVYEEQYKTKTPYVEPGKVANTQLAEAIGQAGKLVTGAIDAKLESDDMVDMARIEADTVLAADKLYRDFQEHADPENFVKDIESQKQNIQSLIQNQSKQFRLAKNQRQFSEKMTRSLEEQFMGKTLSYGYALQEQTFKTRFMEGYDNIDALILSGDTMLDLQTAVNLKTDAARAMAKKYHIPADKLETFIQQQVAKTVSSYAYAMIPKDPQLVMDVLVGKGLEQFRLAKEAVGQNFTIEEFLNSPELQEEYRQSEFGASFVNYLQYLDYPTRKELYDRASYQKDKNDKEAVQLKLQQNAITADELDNWYDTEKANIEQYGTFTNKFGGAHTIDGTVDPRLAVNGQTITMGRITYGLFSKGHYYTKNSEDFAKGISGSTSAMGYIPKLQSNVRPDAKDSKHKDGSATDLGFYKNEVFSVEGCVAGYIAAVTKYGGYIPKGGVLFEIKNEWLSKADRAKLKKPDGTELDVVDYIKSRLKAQGVDLSYADFAGSKKWRDKASGAHVHFSMKKDADYTKSASAGEKVSYQVRSDFGLAVYRSKAASGASPKECYEAAHKKEVELFALMEGEKIVREISVTKNANGAAVYRNPSEYQAALDAKREQIRTANMTTEQRYMALKGLEAAQKRVSEVLAKYPESPVDAVKLMFKNVKTDEDATKILKAPGFGVDTRNTPAYSTNTAKVMADQLQNKLSPTDAVMLVRTKLTSPAKLKQVAQYIKGDKGNLIMYSYLATPGMAENIASAVQNLETTKLMVSKDKRTFGQGWENNVMATIKKDPIMKHFLSNLDKTQPGESAKLLNAMVQMFAYEATQGTAKGAKREVICKKVIDGFIGANYASTSVRTPRETANLVVSRKLPNVDKSLPEIKAVLSVAAAYGIKPTEIWARENTITDAHKSIQAAYTKGNAEERKRQVNAVMRQTTLTSTPDGLAAQFTWAPKDGMRHDVPVLRKSFTAPAEITYKDAIQVYNEATNIVNRYMKSKSGSTYGHPTKSRYISEANMTVPELISRAQAYNLAIHYVLCKKYNWIDTTGVVDFTKVPENRIHKGK